MKKVANSTEALNVLIGLGTEMDMYLPFRVMIDGLQEAADQGDEASKEILSRVCQVANLVLYAKDR